MICSRTNVPIGEIHGVILVPAALHVEKRHQFVQLNTRAVFIQARKRRRFFAILVVLLIPDQDHIVFSPVDVMSCNIATVAMRQE